MPRTISARVDKMDITKIVIPAVSVAIAAGGYMATITAVADDTKNIEDRLRTVEVVQAENKSQAVELKNTVERLDRLEDMIEKLTEQQLVMIKNQSRVCESVGASCE